MAFVLLNRFLDVADLIEESGQGEGLSADPSLLDNSDFDRTDVPFENLLIPSKPCVTGPQKEQAKEWVLAVSLDQRVEQQLPLDDRGVFEACLVNWKRPSESPSTACVLTGYPVHRQPVKFPVAGKEANREDWNRFLVATKRWPDNQHLSDVLNFLDKWCGGLPSVSTQFVF